MIFGNIVLNWLFSKMLGMSLLDPIYYTSDKTDPNYQGNAQTRTYRGLPEFTNTAPVINNPANGNMTVRYPGTEAGKMWYETAKPEALAAKTTETRALGNQKKQVDAAQLARDRAIQSSGYTDMVSGRQDLAPTYDTEYRNKVTNLAPTYSQSVMDTTLGQQRDILEGQASSQKRGLVEAGGGTMPSGYRRQQLLQADVNKEGLYGRAASELSQVKAVQDRLDEVQKIGMLADIGKVDRTDATEKIALAYQQAVMDYGRESDLAQAIERIYSTTVAATPEYAWDELKNIADRMAATQEYNVTTEGGGSGGGEGGGGGVGSEIASGAANTGNGQPSPLRTGYWVGGTSTIGTNPGGLNPSVQQWARDQQVAGKTPAQISTEYQTARKETYKGSKK